MNGILLCIIISLSLLHSNPAASSLLFDSEILTHLHALANPITRDGGAGLQAVLDAILAMQSQESSANPLHSQQVVMLPISALGLANRLRIIASFFPITSTMKLLVLWLKDDACNISAQELFTVAPQWRSQLAFLSFDTAMPDVVFQRTIASWAKTHPHHIVDHYFTRFLVPQNLLESHKINAVFTRGSHAWYDPTSTGFDCRHWIDYKSRFYQALHPTVQLSSVLESFEDRYLSPRGDNVKLVGVHIRAYDPAQDWPVVTPQLHQASNTLSEVLTFDQSSPTEAFISLIRDMLAKGNGRVRFFLASNSMAIKQQLLDIFGDEVILTLLLPIEENDSEVGDRTVYANLLQAFLEFRILGECDFILHSRGSSFAREAAFRRQIPVIDVGGNAAMETALSGRAGSNEAYLAFVSLHPALPFCGSPELIREVQALREEGRLHRNDNAVAARNTNKNHKVCFQEGGDRAMCSYRYIVCPCFVDDVQMYCNREHEEVIPSDCVEVVAESNGYSV